MGILLSWTVATDSGLLRIFGGRPMQNRQRWLGRVTAGSGVSTGEPLVLLSCDVPIDAAMPSVAGVECWLGEAVGYAYAASSDFAERLLINQMSIPPRHDAEFNEWYDTEHMPRLAALDGVLSARRFRAVAGTPMYTALYYLRHCELLQSNEWRAAATTPWTTRIMRLRCAPRRMVFQRSPASVSEPNAVNDAELM